MRVRLVHGYLRWLFVSQKTKEIQGSGAQSGKATPPAASTPPISVTETAVLPLDTSVDVIPTTVVTPGKPAPTVKTPQASPKTTSLQVKRGSLVPLSPCILRHKESSKNVTQTKSGKVSIRTKIWICGKLQSNQQNRCSDRVSLKCEVRPLQFLFIVFDRKDAFLCFRRVRRQRPRCCPPVPQLALKQWQTWWQSSSC